MARLVRWPPYSVAVPRLTLFETILAALLPVLTAVAMVVVFRRHRRDEVFTGVTPGEVPGVGHDRSVARTDGMQWQGSVAPRFTPPDGVTPGLAGTVIDGRVDTRDLTAVLIDLSVRTLVDITPEGSDWRLTRASRGREGELTAYERAVLDTFFGGSDAVLLSALKRPEFVASLHAAEVAVYREVVDRGWYARHPRSRNSTLRTVGLVLLVAALVAVPVTVLGWYHHRLALWAPSLAASVAVAAVLLIRFGRGRTPRTALGSAVRIQSLGFREFLATADGERLRWEEAARIFTAYLPYAVAFGVAQHWTSVVGGIVRSAQVRLAAEHAADVLVAASEGLTDLGNLVYLVDGLGNLADLVPGDLPGIDLLDGVDIAGLDLGGLDVGGADLAGLDLGDVGGFFEGIGSAVGDLGSAIGDLAPSDGCLDGCDAGCLDF